MSQIQISGLLLHLRDKVCIILYHHTQPQNTIFHQFKGKTVSSGSWLTIQPENITVDKQNLSKNSALCETPVTMVILEQKKNSIPPI